MKKYSAFVFLILIFALGSFCIAKEEESGFFDRKISVFNSEEELFDFLKEMEEYNQIDKIYSEEKNKAEERAQKRIFTEIVDGLTADEIGDIPALGIGRPLTSSFYNSQDYSLELNGDYWVLLKEESLYSILLHPDTLSPPEIISQENVIKHNGNSDQQLFVIEGSLIVFNSNSSDDLLAFSFYHIDKDGVIEFEQSYTITSNGSAPDVEIVGNHLVMISSANVSAETIAKSGSFGSLIATRDTSNSEQEELFNIASSVQWLKSSGDIRSNGGNYPNRFYEVESLVEVKTVMNCPIDNLEVGIFECDVINFLGLDQYDEYFLINENAIYLWSESSPSLDYENLTLEAYSDFVRSKVGQQLLSSVGNGNYKKTIYRIELDSGDVGGVVVDSSANRPIELHGSDTLISGLLRKREGNSLSAKNEVELRNFSFNAYEFSLNPSEVSSENYRSVQSNIKQPDDSISIGDNVVMRESVFFKGKESKSAFTVWNTVSNTTVLFYSEIKVRHLRQIENDLLVIGLGKNGQLEFEFWSIEGEPEILNKTSFNQYMAKYSGLLYFDYHEGMDSHVFGLDLSLLNQTDDEGDKLYGVQSFQVASDGDVTLVGNFMGSSSESEVSCDDGSCVESYGEGPPMFFGDYAYMIGETEIIKIDYSSEEIKPSSRLNLLTGESSLEGSKEVNKENN